MELELKYYLKVILKKMWMVALFTIVICVAVGVYSYKLISPIYSASAELVINNSIQSNEENTLNINNLEANIRLINSYKDIIMSPAILDKVTTEYPDLNTSSGQLRSNLGVLVQENSQVMTITMENQSQERAANLVNAVARVFQREIPNIMKVDNVSILNEAQVVSDPLPIKPNPSLNIFVAFVASVFIGIAVIYLFESLNTTIRTEAEIEQFLGAPLLAEVSNIKKRDLKKKSKIITSKVSDTYAGINA